MSKPLVTVGLQVYNCERTVGSAIVSILQQSCSDWELIIHDDGSIDRTVEIVRSFQDQRIQLFQDSINRKRPYRINQSLEVARGKYYALMDGDDIAYPDRLGKQVHFLEQQPAVHLVGGGMMVFNSEGNPAGKRQPPTRHEQICSRPWSGFPLAQPTFLGRTDWFKKYRYVEDVAPAEDQDLLIRSYQHSRFANVPDILLGYREPRLVWRRIARSRFYWSRSLWRQFHIEGRLGLALMAVLLQIIKSGVDLFAIRTGLDYHILRHRASPVTEAERQRWQQVYETVSPLSVGRESWNSF